MKPEWPIARPQADAGQPLLPLAMHEHVELVKASPTVGAFCEQRAVQMLPPFNHTPEHDLDLDVDQLVRHAEDRLRAYLEIVGRGRTDLPRDRRDILIRKLEVAGGLLIAAHQRAIATIETEGEE